jgi:DNA polymerase elongation subunit (family B)
MYRNIYYNNNKGAITLWTWNDQGDRTEYETPFKPYIYIESQNSKDAVSIYNTPLRKIEFKNQYERRKYIEESGIKRIFHNVNVEQQFLLEQFGTISTTPEFSKHPLKIFYIDIEIAIEAGGEFPDPTEAKYPINLLTIYDNLSEKYYTWGLQEDYTPDKDNVEYFQCYSESDLLKKFLNFWSSDYPDLLTGWNIDTFDTPYIINRITNVLGEDYAKQLSPIGQIFKRDGVIKRFGKIESKWYIRGVSFLDYMEVYKTFAREQQEKYSLDYIAEVELGENKLSYSARDLGELAKTDWKTFTDYNIRDVELVLRIEQKLKFLELIRSFAYLGLTTFEKSLGTISVVTGAMAVKAEEAGMKIATFNTTQQPNYEGGYVREPNRGLKEAVISYDANSLYPNTIITLNISPETKMGKILHIDDEKVNFRLVTGKEYTLTHEKFCEFIKKEKISVSKARVLYSQKTKGICPKLVDGIYQQRLEIKERVKKHTEALKHCKEGSEKYVEHKKMLDYYDLYQFSLKIAINRVYGAFANAHSPFCDVDAASSITLTGQGCIKEATNIVNRFAKKKYGIDEDLCMYNDTDSVVFETLIRTDHGVFQIGDLFNENYIGEKKISNSGHEIIKPKEKIKCLTFNTITKKVEFKEIKHLMRHKVTKKKYKIKVGDKEIILTEDHACMVLRDEKLIRVSPKDIKNTDKMVNIYNDTADV